MNLTGIQHIYFLGIGGIGMSALARYFKFHGYNVSGYDKTATKLSKQLEKEGITISYQDQGKAIEKQLPKKEVTLIVYTPAVPDDHQEFMFFKEQNYIIKKRAEVLGLITKKHSGLAVAGTHGKTTTSTMLAHLLQTSDKKCNAFLGGISSNYNSNLIIEKNSPWVVVEADEFDRSFLHLYPEASIITSTEADHLDIYKSPQHLVDAFELYAQQINKNGVLIHQYKIDIEAPCKKYSYGINPTLENVDYTGNNLQFSNGVFTMDVSTPTGKWKKVALGIPGIHNAENALSVIAMGQYLDLDEGIIRKALASFKGVKRRFEYHLNTEESIYIDDYAHHPTAINSLIASLRLLYPDRKITGIFQPHLYSRTADFMDDFADSLSKLDEVILLPIYPAREKPIEGITSEVLLDKINCYRKHLNSLEDVVNMVDKKNHDIILSIGAGDIDKIIEPLKNKLS